MIAVLLEWFTPALVLIGFIASLAIAQYKQREHEKSFSQLKDEMETHRTRLVRLEQNEAVANSKREDMMRVLEENAKDVKNILSEIAKLATMLSIVKREDQ